MINFEHATYITATKAMTLILDACRANEDRQDTRFVRFTRTADGNHCVALRNEDGIVVATATVDQFDC